MIELTKIVQEQSFQDFYTLNQIDPNFKKDKKLQVLRNLHAI
jgi:hypothetical protein